MSQSWSDSPYPRTILAWTSPRALASPVEHGAIVLDHLSRRTAERREAATLRPTRQLGLAAHSVGDFVRAERFYDAHAQFYRAQGCSADSSVAGEARVDKIQLGDWRSAVSMASEAGAIGSETGQLDLAAAANLAAATIAAYRGETRASLSGSPPPARG